MDEQERIKRARESQRKYYYSDKGRKKFIIKGWKKIGVNCDDFDALYKRYEECKNCEHCNIELIRGRSSNSKCLDHDHHTRLVRNILCRACNNKLPKQI